MIYLRLYLPFAPEISGPQVMNGRWGDAHNQPERDQVATPTSFR